MGLVRRLREVAAAGRIFLRPRLLPLLPGRQWECAGTGGEFYVLPSGLPLRLRIEGIKPVTGGFDLAGIKHDAHRQL